MLVGASLKEISSKGILINFMRLTMSAFGAVKGITHLAAFEAGVKYHAS